MTREQAKREIDSLDYYLQNHTDDYSEESHAAMMMAIKALEQEPCEDAISRQAAIDAFGLSEKTRKYGGNHSGYDTMMLYEIQQTLEDLPSVTPKQRTGHWIESRCDMYVCSECGNTYTDLSGERYGMNCCPNCGARMTEVTDD